MNQGDRIRLLRISKGYTLEELGKKVGVGKSTVRKWETGDIENMRRDSIEKLASALGVSPLYIMGISENIPSDTLTPAEHELIADYRDATEEIREEAAGMLHRSAERNRKDRRQIG